MTALCHVHPRPAPQNGAAYAGYFVEGSRQGRGLLVLPDGSRYCGQFMKDKYEGRGDYFYPDGALYRGTWKNGLRHGQGVYWYPGHESCLNGTWNEGFLSGEGVHEVPRHVSRGAYAKGVPSGEAVFTLSHQDRVRGLPFFAAEHILKDHGPTLTFVGARQLRRPFAVVAPAPCHRRFHDRSFPFLDNPHPMLCDGYTPWHPVDPAATLRTRMHRH